MSDTPIEGGAGPALAAHSKDGAAPGANPASSTMPDDRRGGGASETVTRLSDQARQASARVASSVSDAASGARQAVAGQGGRALEQTAGFVREQPIAALAITGAVGIVLGVLLARR